jgi:NADPH-dependent 2,4-dienoyl-CoA reductase/sulfur reductase-like enzyme
MKDSAAFQIVVVGAGPAGLAAACAASERAQSVALVDANPAPGGQIWRGERTAWIERAEASDVRVFCGTQAVCVSGERALFAVQGDRAIEIKYESLILATGARERFLPFPGWTLPNVMGAGGLQALVKGGMPIAGKRVVVAGSGPLLLAAAAYLRKQGARIALVAEQASRAAVWKFAGAAALSASKRRQSIGLLRQLAGVRYRTGCWPAEAAPGEVRMTREGGASWSEPCDYLACGFGLAPNTGLAALLGCELKDGFVIVDSRQQTTQPGIYCAGEPTGIGGLELAVTEGRIAGYAATGDIERARTLFAERDRGNRFARALEAAFRLRAELRELARPDVIVCRCEDVPFGRIAQHRTWQAIKMQTRCGMGPCQGRVCGPAVEFLLGIPPDSVRPPIYPVPVGLLAEDV